jgi:hypothetical protein
MMTRTQDLNLISSLEPRTGFHAISKSYLRLLFLELAFKHLNDALAFLTVFQVIVFPSV